MTQKSVISRRRRAQFTFGLHPSWKPSMSSSLLRIIPLLSTVSHLTVIATIWMERRLSPPFLSSVLSCITPSLDLDLSLRILSVSCDRASDLRLRPGEAHTALCSPCLGPSVRLRVVSVCLAAPHQSLIVPGLPGSRQRGSTVVGSVGTGGVAG